MGRLWQTLTPSRWKPLFALVPVESLIRDQQAGYYAGLNAVNRVGSSTPFIAFILQIISDALATLRSTRSSDRSSNRSSNRSSRADA
jgi:Fic family protein